MAYLTVSRAWRDICSSSGIMSGTMALRSAFAAASSAAMLGRTLSGLRLASRCAAGSSVPCRWAHNVVNKVETLQTSRSAISRLCQTRPALSRNRTYMSCSPDHSL